MKLGIFSDIHSNLPALEAILADAEKQQVNKLISLGDNIGYGPSPNEVLDKLDNLYIEIVGNHEHIISKIIHKKELDYQINNKAYSLMQWTLNQLNDKNKERIIQTTIFENYKKTIKINEIEISFSHSNPYWPFSMQYYIEDVEQARDFCLKNQWVKSKFNFVGHSHIPQVYPRNENSAKRSDRYGYDLSECDQALIVVPGAGQPRENFYKNEKKKTGYVIFDTESQKLEMIRLNYDWDKMINLIQEKMPSFLDYHKKQGYLGLK